YQPLDALTLTVEQLLGQSPNEVREKPAHEPWEHAPWRAFLPHELRQWHPALIHFPIVFLMLELAFHLAASFRASPALEKAAFGSLTAAVLSFFPAIYAGLSDVGAALGPGV